MIEPNSLVGNSVQFETLSNVWMVAIYPLIAFAIIMFGRWQGFLKTKPVTAAIVVLSTLMSFLHTLGVFNVYKEIIGITPTIGETFHWLHVGALHMDVGWMLDPTGFMMLFVVTVVSALIQVYTYGYMEEDPNFHRFYAYLALFNFSMLALVLAPNLVQMYMFWEMVGVSSYLLIGFWVSRPSAASAAVKAFLMNRVGDFGLLVGLLSFTFLTWAFWSGDAAPGLLSFPALGKASEYLMLHHGTAIFSIVGLLIFLGPVAKSAQLPLHTWLPDAMEGPTPISALIHAATMVAAGVFLIARMYPMYNMPGGEMIMTVIAWVGGLTAVVAATIALTQFDIKKALAYSTMSQLGYMVMAMGLGAYAAGLFHLMTHAFFKAMLFLASGSVIHGCHHEQDMRRMGGLHKTMPITAWVYLIGTIAITGVLPFSGFWSKDEIVAAAFSHQTLLYYIAVGTAGLTAFYMFRTYFMTFTGQYRGHHEAHESPLVMTLPLILLAIPSIGIGWLLSGFFVTDFPSFATLINAPASFHHHAAHHINWTVLGTSMVVVMGGFAAAFAMYSPMRLLDPALFVNGAKPLYTLFSNKWYWDEFYSFIARQVYLTVAQVSAWFDKAVIDGLVGLSAFSVNMSASGLRQLQNGRVQSYLLVFVLGLLLLSAYTAVQWLN
ncbi:MAG: NADH-quinone oxidoreductase subunit L [Vampirovibrionales bacterium]